MNILCQEDEQTIRQYTLNVIQTVGTRCGFAIGSGNSIPNYVPVEGYQAMIQTVREYRGD